MSKERPTPRRTAEELGLKPTDWIREEIKAKLGISHEQAEVIAQKLRVDTLVDAIHISVVGKDCNCPTCEYLRDHLKLLKGD